jgi:hypothetical protein
MLKSFKIGVCLNVLVLMIDLFIRGYHRSPIPYLQSSFADTNAPTPGLNRTGKTIGSR